MAAYESVEVAVRLVAEARGCALASRDPCAFLSVFVEGDLFTDRAVGRACACLSAVFDAGRAVMALRLYFPFHSTPFLDKTIRGLLGEMHALALDARPLPEVSWIDFAPTSAGARTLSPARAAVTKNNLAMFALHELIGVKSKQDITGGGKSLSYFVSLLCRMFERDPALQALCNCGNRFPRGSAKRLIQENVQGYKNYREPDGYERTMARVRDLYSQRDRKRN